MATKRDCEACLVGDIAAVFFSKKVNDVRKKRLLLDGAPFRTHVSCHTAMSCLVLLCGESFGSYEVHVVVPVNCTV